LMRLLSIFDIFTPSSQCRTAGEKKKTTPGFVTRGGGGAQAKKKKKKRPNLSKNLLWSLILFCPVAETGTTVKGRKKNPGRKRGGRGGERKGGSDHLLPSSFVSSYATGEAEKEGELKGETPGASIAHQNGELG